MIGFASIRGVAARSLVALAGIVLGFATPVAAAESEGTNTAPALSGYAAFRPISDRNIFNTKRSSRTADTPRQARATPRFETINLVGVLQDDQQALAFFDGSSREHQKVLKQDEVIAGYRVVSISCSRVTLETDSGKLELEIGAQLRREEDGPWRLTESGETRIDSPPASAAAESEAETKPGDDVLQRLLKQREKELQ